MCLCTPRLVTLFLIVPDGQLHSIAQGLKYLHDANLAHGDLKVVRV